MRYLSALPLILTCATATADDLALRSPDIAVGETMAERHVFNGFGCSGGNLSPALSWDGAPAATKSYAVTAYDPDAPTGSGWWHWVVYNIPATSHSLERGAGAIGATPHGASQGRTDFGSAGYGGPCPPPGHGRHRYQFTVYALDVERLDLPADASAALVGFHLHTHRLDEARIEAVYQR